MDNRIDDAARADDVSGSVSAKSGNRAGKRQAFGEVKAPLVLAICAVLALGGAAAMLQRTDEGTKRDAGATVSDYRNMTRDEIQAELDKTVRDNMMTVSVAARAALSEHGIVRINAINDASNKFSQRYSLIQDGRVIYESGAVDPGNAIESCHADDAHAGEAYVEVQAVDIETLKDHGNPTRVKIDITENPV